MGFYQGFLSNASVNEINTAVEVAKEKFVLGDWRSIALEPAEKLAICANLRSKSI